MDETAKIDLKDRRIISALDMYARMPLGELAKKAGVSRQVATYRIERMRREGIIAGAYTIFDSAVAGYNWYRVLMRLGGGGTAKKSEILQFLSRHPHALWVGEVGGNWDIIVNFITRDTYEFNAIFERVLERYGRFIATYETLVYIHVRDQSRAYILGGEGEERRSEFDHPMRFDPALALDEVDKKIVHILTKDSFLSNWKIAAKIGVSDKTVTARIRRMEAKKLIVGYRLFIHAGTIGYETYMVFLGIHNLASERENRLDGFLRANPNVTFVVRHIGRWRIGMEVEVRNRVEFQKFLVELRDAFGDIIAEFETFPVFKDYLVNYFPDGNLK